MGIFASSCESSSCVLIENMASGLPIACSNRGPMPEVLKDGGVYFDPEKPIDILLDFMGRKVPAQVTIDKVNPVQYSIHHTNNISRRSRGRGRLTRQYREYQKINAGILQ